MLLGLSAALSLFWQYWGILSGTEAYDDRSMPLLDATEQVGFLARFAFVDYIAPASQVHHSCISRAWWPLFMLLLFWQCWDILMKAEPFWHGGRSVPLLDATERVRVFAFVHCKASASVVQCLCISCASFVLAELLAVLSVI